jgi:hypothetical protein
MEKGGRIIAKGNKIMKEGKGRQYAVVGQYL